jgi:hypothetical protein
MTQHEAPQNICRQSRPEFVQQRRRARPKVMDVAVRHQMRSVALIDRGVERDGCGPAAVERAVSAAVPDRIDTDRLGVAEDREPIGIGRELCVRPIVHELAIGCPGVRRPPSRDRGHDADLDVRKPRRRIEAADHRNERRQAVFDHVGPTEFGPAVEQNAVRLVLIVGPSLNDEDKLLIGRHRNALQIGLLICPGPGRTRIGPAWERCEPPAAVRKFPADARTWTRRIGGIGGPVPEAREIRGRGVGCGLRGNRLRPALILRQRQFRMHGEARGGIHEAVAHHHAELWMRIPVLLVDKRGVGSLLVDRIGDCTVGEDRGVRRNQSLISRIVKFGIGCARAIRDAREVEHGAGLRRSARARADDAVALHGAWEDENSAVARGLQEGRRLHIPGCRGARTADGGRAEQCRRAKQCLAAGENVHRWPCST